MKDYIIFTDSCADLDPKMIAELGIEVLPMHFTMDGKTYANWPDGRDIPFEKFYSKLRDGSMSSTSQANTLEFVDAFRPYVEKGLDLLYIGFSSGLSGTVNSGFLAAETLMKEYPESKVLVVDSLAASLGQGLLVWHAVQQKKAGKTVDEVALWVEEHRLEQAHWFTVDDLGFLRRGGRISGTVALLGTMIGIKPVLHVDDEGHLVNVSKTRGRKKSLDALVDRMEQTAVNPKDQMIFISHGDCLDEAKYVEKEIRRRFGTKDIYINFIGPVIGSHSGPGTMALFFMATGR